MKRAFFLLFAVALLPALPALAANAMGHDVSGNYKMTSTGDFVTQTAVNFSQHGSTVIGKYGQNGHISGTLTGMTLSGTWKDTRGAGWLTFHFSSNGFDGQWGYHGKKPNGKVIGSRIPAKPMPKKK